MESHVNANDESDNWISKHVNVVRSSRCILTYIRRYCWSNCRSDVDGKSEMVVCTLVRAMLYVAMFMRRRSHALAAARIPFRHLCVSTQVKWLYRKSAELEEDTNRVKYRKSENDFFSSSLFVCLRLLPFRFVSYDFPIMTARGYIVTAYSHSLGILMPDSLCRSN